MVSGESEAKAASFITGFRMLTELAHGRAKSREDFPRLRYDGGKTSRTLDGDDEDDEYDEEQGNSHRVGKRPLLKSTPRRKEHNKENCVDPDDMDEDLEAERPGSEESSEADSQLRSPVRTIAASNLQKVVGPRSLNGFSFHALVPQEENIGGEVHWTGLSKCRCKGSGCVACGAATEDGDSDSASTLPYSDSFEKAGSLDGERVCELGSGDDHHIALTSDGRVFTWGRGDKGQLGHGNYDSLSEPTLVEGLKGIVVRQVCCGQWHCVVLSELGEVFTWGADADLCQKASPGCIKVPSHTPRKLEIDKKAVYIAAGYTHSLCVSETGHLYSWGHGQNSQRRYGWEKVAQPKPMIINKMPNKRVAEVSAGTNLTVLTTVGQGEVYSWGRGYIGVGDFCEKKNPTLVKNMVGKRVVRVSCGPVFCHLVSDEGHVYSFGHGDHGVLGHGDTKHQGTPKLVQALRGLSIISVSCGSRHAAAVTVWGETYVWGSNKAGQLGLEASEEPILEPVKASLSGRVADVACGTHHTLCCSAVRSPTFYLSKGNGEMMIEEILVNMGWARVPRELRWTSKFTLKWVQNSSEIDFRMMKEGYQLVNHIPNHRVFTSKNGLLQTLREYSQRHSDVSLYSFLPETFRLDNLHEKKEFFEMALNNEEDTNDTLWILKPTSLNCGQGIEVIRDVRKLAEEFDYVLPSRTREERRRFSLSPPRVKLDNSPPLSPQRTRETSPTRNSRVESEGTTEDSNIRIARGLQLSPVRGRLSHNALVESPQQTQSPTTGKNNQQSPTSGRLLPWQNTRRERKTYPHIIQRYISNVLTIDNKKFDIRVYMYIASTEPFLVFYHPGYLRLSLEPLDLANETNTFSHLTNAAIQKKHPDYETRIGENIWSFERFQQYLTANKIAPPGWVNGAMTTRMKEIMVTLTHASKNKLGKKIGCFDLYGIDFMLDTNLNCWLIEVNTNPAITRDCDLLSQILPPILTETVHIALEVFHLQQQQKVHAVPNVEITSTNLSTLSSFHTIVDEGLRNPYYFSEANPVCIAPAQSKPAAEKSEDGVVPGRDDGSPMDHAESNREDEDPVDPDGHVPL